MLLKLPISESNMLNKLTRETAGRNGECGSFIACVVPVINFQFLSYKSIDIFIK